eukprot:CAMPEP_0201655104 /NCGR_PEP_ID=MMETSP0493-20130528/45838_1 /ASSEMBLY_ACC=CAM_ASM_000838 /TAXON_ID=420259 /ORGANISM="Thalassiosira gravida, Strain GMp14c1" /LENGTH=362 /DNA_ID=CAMNT_0048131681 /DNA_START=79 /DNA_END=1167 /DNA_ORIENTATION=+
MKYISVVSALSFAAQSSNARPSTLDEQSLSYFQGFIKGSYVGFESLLALAGFYENDDVKNNLNSNEESFQVHANEKESQTHIKIAGLGLGRTGSTSLVMALEILGYVVIHDDEQAEETDVYSAYEDELFDDDRFHEILGLRGYNATFKTAGHEWVAAHPEVKGILTVRDDPDKYVDSWLVAAPFIDIMEQRPFKWMRTVEELMPELSYEYRHTTTGGDVENYLDRDVLRQKYIEYNKEVRIRCVLSKTSRCSRPSFAKISFLFVCCVPNISLIQVQDTIPSERLLTFNVKQGWEPLCEFLGHPDPPQGIPFPHVHTRSKLEGEMFFLRMVTWVWKLFEVILFVSFLIAMRKAKAVITKDKEE